MEGDHWDIDCASVSETLGLEAAEQVYKVFSCFLLFKGFGFTFVIGRIYLSIYVCIYLSDIIFIVYMWTKEDNSDIVSLIRGILPSRECPMEA